MKPLLYAFAAWAAVLFGAYLVLDKLVMPFISGQFKDTVKVGEFIGKSPVAAKENLVKAGLIPVMDSLGEYSPDIAAGKILTQRPLANTEVKEGRRVWYTVSKGLNRVVMPNLRGNSLRQAEISLQQLGLKVDTVIETRRTNLPEGMVIKTAPKPGSALSVHSEVVLYLSESRKNRDGKLLQFVGMPAHRVKQILDEYDLKLGEVRYKEDAGVLPNTVIRQKPHAGTRLAKGMSVHLTLSKR